MNVETVNSKSLITHLANVILFLLDTDFFFFFLSDWSVHMQEVAETTKAKSFIYYFQISTKSLFPSRGDDLFIQEC